MCGAWVIAWIIFMINKVGISKQLIIALSIVNLSVTACSVFFGYFIYSYAIETGWISLETLNEDWSEFHSVDWVWLFFVLLFGSVLSIILGVKLANRFITPINFLADAAKKIRQGDLSARVADEGGHSAEILELMHNFNGMAQQLETSVKNAQVWNAAIAHELRTPITILQGRLQGILDGVFQPDPVLFKSLLNQAEGLSHLVEDLRTLSLIENQQLRLNFELIDLQYSVEKVLLVFKERLHQAGFKIQLELITTQVYCDSRRIEQILIALIDNAIRYANAGTLRISSNRIEQSWVLQVEDEGPGIPAQFQQDLFNPFFRLEQSRNKEFGGTGLGLAVVQAIVVAHKGLIKYDNLKNNSVFSLVFPMKVD